MAAQKVVYAGVAAGVMSLVLTARGGNDDTTTTTTAPEQESTIAELAVATDELAVAFC